MNWIKRVFRGWRRPAWVLGILATILILAWIVLDVASGIKLRRAIAALQEADLTMDVREIVSPKVPAEENAAVILNHVIPMRESRLVTINDHDVWTRPIELTDRRVQGMEKRAREIGDELFVQLDAGDISSDLVDELTTLLGEPTLAYKLRMARQAVAYSRFDAYLDYEVWPDLLLPHVGAVRGLGKLLHAEAALNAAEGRWPEAFDAVTVSLQLGELLLDEPLVISQLTSQALQHLALRKIEVLLRLQPHFDDNLGRLREILDRGNESDVVRAIMVEMTMNVHYLYRKLENGEFDPLEFAASDGVNPFPWMDRGIFRPLHKADFATFLDSYRERVEILRRGSDKMDHYRLMSEWEDSVTFPWYAPVARNLFFLSSRVHLSGVEVSARLALARVALAAQDYRAATGQWPATLEDLVPNYLPRIPRDPYDRDVLRYDRNDERVVIYSVGPNVKDDGGQRVERSYPDQPGDIVWVLE